MPTVMMTMMGIHSVLLVEDDTDVRDCVEELLVEEGYAVRTAANGAEALLLLASGPLPTVMLLDMHMPVMSGPEVLAAIARDARLGELTIVLFTADNVPVAASGWPVLRKPLKLQDLLGTVAAICGGSGVIPTSRATKTGAQPRVAPAIERRRGERTG